MVRSRYAWATIAVQTYRVMEFIIIISFTVHLYDTDDLGEATLQVAGLLDALDASEFSSPG